MSSVAVKASRPLRVAGALCAAAAVSLSLSACGSSGSGQAEKSPKASVSAKASPSSSASTSAGASGTTGGTTGTGTGTTGGGTTGTTGTGGGGTGGPTLNVSQTAAPLCPGGTNLAPIAGQNIAFTFTSTGATNVRLDIDGGLYGTYGPSDTLSLAFPCSGPENSTVTHTYTFTTIPGGTSKTLTGTATQHVVTNVGDGGMNPAPPSGSSSP
jgi:hypothetical protein